MDPNFIGHLEKKTILKFPLVPPNEDEGVYTTEGLQYRKNIRNAVVEGLKVEEQILRRLGHHPRIIRFLERHEDGIVLEYMPNGSVERYLRDIAPDTPLEQKLEWAWQAAEGLAFIHEKNVLHCDFSVGNLLLSDDLSIKLCDFQGRLLGSDGVVLLNGGAAEGSMSSMPREDRNHCDQRTDIFAFGTALYFMMTGLPPFPDLDTADDEDEIRRRFECHEFPSLERYRWASVVRKCWIGSYSCATEIMSDLQKIKGG